MPKDSEEIQSPTEITKMLKIEKEGTMLMTDEHAITKESPTQITKEPSSDWVPLLILIVSRFSTMKIENHCDHYTFFTDCFTRYKSMNY